MSDREATVLKILGVVAAAVASGFLLDALFFSVLFSDDDTTITADEASVVSAEDGDVTGDAISEVTGDVTGDVAGDVTNQDVSGSKVISISGGSGDDADAPSVIISGDGDGDIYVNILDKDAGSSESATNTTVDRLDDQHDDQQDGQADEQHHDQQDGQQGEQHDDRQDGQQDDQQISSFSHGDIYDLEPQRMDEIGDDTWWQPDAEIRQHSYGDIGFWYTLSVGNRTKIDNWARWEFEAEDDRYLVQVFVPNLYATSHVQYFIGIDHDEDGVFDDDELVDDPWLDQAASPGWRTLGTYDLSGHVQVEVRDTEARDDFEEDGRDDSRLAIDAMRLRPASSDDEE